MSARRAWWGICILAIAAAIVPLPEYSVERWYSDGVYPMLQRWVTRASNLVPFALFDVFCVALGLAFVVAASRRFRDDGWRRGSVAAVTLLLRGAAVLYLVFLISWGLNYRRVPISRKVAFDRSRLTAAAVDALAVRAVDSLNETYVAAHRTATSLPELARAFTEAQAVLRAPMPIVPARPKQTLLGPYFHYASISGMTDPFFLETLIAPDLFEFERPYVIAHEWGHLAGYADESEASFLAWIACMRSDDAARYSAWISLIGSLQAYLPRDRPFRGLQAGPRSDLAAMRARYLRTSPTLRKAARTSYDKYLKANRVREGVESYDAVVQLILGTGADVRGVPLPR
jgi:uncharacterized protein DUF3810